MAEPYFFTSGTDFYDWFMPNNCARGDGCWHDRDEQCPILLALITDQTHPQVVGTPQGGARCRNFLSMADGKRGLNKQEAQQLAAEHLAQHGGGLPLEGLPDA